MSYSEAQTRLLILMASDARREGLPSRWARKYRHEAKYWMRTMRRAWRELRALGVFGGRRTRKTELTPRPGSPLDEEA